MAKHAKLSASSAERWMVCPGSVPLSKDYPNTSSEYADEGTAAHYLGSVCLANGTEPKQYLKRTILLMEDVLSGEHYECFDDESVRNDADRKLNEFVITSDMVEHVGKYVSDVRRVALGLNGSILVEQSLPLTFLTSESDAEGTSDAVIISPTLVVADLKYGMGVRVEAKDNPQLLMYASAAREQYSMVNDFEDVHVAILQPRLDHISQYTYSHADLDVFEEEVKTAVIRVHAAEELYEQGGDLSHDFLNPTEKGCMWCKHKANCTALAAYVSEQIDADFEDLSEVKDIEHYVNVKVEPYDPETISLKMKSLGLIEMWMKAVRGEVESLLLKGLPVPGYKLVEGKMGHRKWANEQEAEAMMKSMRLKEDEMYDKKLISPTSAEKVLKESPKRWARIKDLITQTRGGPSVAPESDKRPAMAITPVGDDMEDLSNDDLIG